MTAFDKAWNIAKAGEYVVQPGTPLGQRLMTGAGDWARGAISGGIANPLEAAREGQRMRTGFTADQQVKLNQQYTQGKQEMERGKYIGSDANLMANATPEIQGDGIDNDGDGQVDEPPTIEEKTSTTINPNTGAPAETTTTTTVSNPTEQAAATNAAAATVASDGTNPAPATTEGGGQPSSQTDLANQATQAAAKTAVANNQQALTDARAKAGTSGGMATNPLAFLATGGLANVAGAAYNWNKRRQGRNELAQAQNQQQRLMAGDVSAIQNSISENIADYWELQKTRSEIREHNTTEAIRFAYD